MDQPKRYHPHHVTLHWLIALGIFYNLYLGTFVFSERSRGGFQLRPIHMAVGITILVLLLVRLVLRFTVKRLADATAGFKLLDIIAKVVHYGLYLTVLVVIHILAALYHQFIRRDNLFARMWYGSR